MLACILFATALAAARKAFTPDLAFQLRPVQAEQIVDLIDKDTEVNFIDEDAQAEEAAVDAGGEISFADLDQDTDAYTATVQDNLMVIDDGLGFMPISLANLTASRTMTTVFPAGCGVSPCGKGDNCKCIDPGGLCQKCKPSKDCPPGWYRYKSTHKGGPSDKSCSHYMKAATDRHKLAQAAKADRDELAIQSIMGPEQHRQAKANNQQAKGNAQRAVQDAQRGNYRNNMHNVSRMPAGGYTPDPNAGLKASDPNAKTGLFGLW